MQFTLGAVFFAFLLIYGGARFYKSFALLGMDSGPGWTIRQTGNVVRVNQPRSVEALGLLQERDEVVTLNGQTIKSASDVAKVFHKIEPGAPYTMRIRRGGTLFEIALRSQEIPLMAWIVNGAASLVIPNIFLLTGLIVFMLKPDDKQAMLLALMFGMFNAAILAVDPTYSGEPAVMVAIMLTVHLVSLFLWPVFFHFFLIFPEPSPLVRKVPRLEAYLYLPQLLTIFPYLALLHILSAVSSDQVEAFSYPVFSLITIFVIILYVAGGLLSLLVNYQQAGRKSKRKMRVVVAGSIAGFLPMFLLIGLAIVFNLSRTNPFMQWLVVCALFSFPLFPLSFAYAIVRHQVIPVRLILRRSVRYLLISRGFIIIQAVVVFAVLSFLLTGSRLAAIDSLGERADIVVTMAATALAIAGLTFLNQRVMPIIDRRFFRESYDAQQVLSELGLEMRKVSTVEQLLERAVAKIQDALHVENVTIFLLDRESGDYVCAISSRLTDDRVTTTHRDASLVLSPDGALVRRISRFANPVPVDFDRYSPWAQNVLAADLAMNDERKRENATLARLRSALLLPVATKDELLGIVSLGPRLGDLPFSRDDRHLLMAVALQMAFAIQNAELVQEIAVEERLRHELAIATTVQQRLFPERPPRMASLDLAGVCHPARGVGGDYYDFIELEGGKVGIAVADVAGKGISAALLMCTVQASLRSHAPAVNGNLTELVSSMNHLLHVSTDASAFATFFYAQFEEQTKLLTYVNAGHNPPMLVRTGATVRARGAGYASAAAHAGLMLDSDSQPDRDESEVRLLTKGGPIIGAFLGCSYEQETLQMERGDLLVAYTDGVTEARNADDQEFGEARLRGIVNSSADLPSQELSERIVQSVRDWCGDVAPHDDLTLVVMKVR
ncbi:MAG TPA: SpoIIE family protein phosphatase [Blastocatellia bacterium]|nr:SpoIIE family protein phosphatase [Blastocatellia bacterium]